MRLPRWFCSLLKHPFNLWIMDEFGEFLVQDCYTYQTMVIRDLVGDHTKEDYEAVLDRWLVGWR